MSVAAGTGTMRAAGAITATSRRALRASESSTPPIRVGSTRASDGPSPRRSPGWRSRAASRAARRRAHRPPGRPPDSRPAACPARCAAAAPRPGTAGGATGEDATHGACAACRAAHRARASIVRSRARARHDGVDGRDFDVRALLLARHPGARRVRASRPGGRRRAVRRRRAAPVGPGRRRQGPHGRDARARGEHSSSPSRRLSCARTRSSSRRSRTSCSTSARAWASFRPTRRVASVPTSCS